MAQPEPPRISRRLDVVEWDVAAPPRLDVVIRAFPGILALVDPGR